jgi:hypothetical protein
MYCVTTGVTVTGARLARARHRRRRRRGVRHGQDRVDQRLGVELALDRELTRDDLAGGRGLTDAVDRDTRRDALALEGVSRRHVPDRRNRRRVVVDDLMRLGLDLVAGDRPVAGEAVLDLGPGSPGLGVALADVAAAGVVVRIGAGRAGRAGPAGRHRRDAVGLDERRADDRCQSGGGPSTPSVAASRRRAGEELSNFVSIRRCEARSLAQSRFVDRVCGLYARLDAIRLSNHRTGSSLVD